MFDSAGDAGTEGAWSFFGSLGQGVRGAVDHVGTKLSETSESLKSTISDYYGFASEVGGNLIDDFTESPVGFAVDGLGKSTEALGQTFDDVAGSTARALDEFAGTLEPARSLIQQVEDNDWQLFEGATDLFSETNNAVQSGFSFLRDTTVEGFSLLDRAVDDFSERAVETADLLGDVATDAARSTFQDLDSYGQTFTDWAVDGIARAGREYDRWNEFAYDFQMAFYDNAADDLELFGRSFMRGSAALGSTLGGAVETAGEFYQEAFDTAIEGAESRGTTDGFYYNASSLLSRFAGGVEQAGAWLRKEGDQRAEWWLETPDQPFSQRLWENPGETIIRSGGELLPSLMLFGGMSGATATATGAGLGFSNGMLRGKDEGREFDARVVDGVLTGGLSAGLATVSGRLADRYTQSNFVNGPLIEASTSGAEEFGNALLDWRATGSFPDDAWDRIFEAMLTAGSSSVSSRTAGSTSDPKGD